MTLQVVDVENYSSLNKLILTMFFVLKFILLIRNKFSDDIMRDEIVFLNPGVRSDKMLVLVNNLN